MRDGAALTLLKAWNTGHPGEVTTIHSNSAGSALQRREQLTAEVSQQPMQAVIGDAVDLIISIERTGRGRRVTDILHVERFSAGQYQIQSYANEAEQNDFARRLMYVVLVAGILLGATQIVGLFGATGASIGSVTERTPTFLSERGGEGRRNMADPVSNLRRNRIHRALSRPNLLMGADRELVLITALAAIILIFVVLTVYSVLFGSPCGSLSWPLCG